MVGVGVRRMPVVPVRVIMLVVVVVVVVVIVVALAMAWATQRQGDSVGLAGARALPLTEGAALHQPFHVVMVAVL